MATAYHDQISTSAVTLGEPAPTHLDADGSLRAELQQVLRAPERAFGQSFSVVDATTGNVVHAAVDGLNCDLYKRLATCEEIARRGWPEVLEDFAPLLMLAVPLPTGATDPLHVAISTFLTQPVESESQIKAAAHEFGVTTEQALRWAQSQTVWLPHTVLEVGTAVAERMAMQQTNVQLKRQLADLSSHLLSTFEEITLLHRLTEHLSISKSIAELCEVSVAWLSDVVPAKCVAIWFESMSDLHDSHTPGDGNGQRPLLIAHGVCPLDDDEVERFIERLGPRVATEPLVLNRGATGCPTWYYPQIREMISVPIREGGNVFGWILALNHTGAGDITNSEVEFGTVEASLMASVATILGIHSGNILLYQQQSEFFASMVHALTSAIDAKDQYTCGHSDRVARLSVCLARQMGCTNEQLNTLYLSGLLHDIGKIGIDDNVLRKPGPLTPSELEHIKTHPDLGCQILDGVKQLDQVLPVVRHHHEAWDGNGYPDRLRGEESPLLARIVAVADAIDAMSSDRPYRKGMPDEKLDQILRDGAGRQWDPRVIETVFRVREEIRRIGKSERIPLALDVDRWQAEAEPALVGSER